MVDKIIGRRNRLEQVDRSIHAWMHRYGHFLHRVCLGWLFVWWGLLKLFGYESATSLIAMTVYIGDPSVTVPLLGLWEAAIGACLLHKSLLRIGLLLLFVRLPGTLVALMVQTEVTFEGSLFVPSIYGQYLIKDLILFGAAAVIGGTVRRRPSGERWD